MPQIEYKHRHYARSGLDPSQIYRWIVRPTVSSARQPSMVHGPDTVHDATSCTLMDPDGVKIVLQSPPVHPTTPISGRFAWQASPASTRCAQNSGSTIRTIPG